MGGIVVAVDQGLSERSSAQVALLRPKGRFFDLVLGPVLGFQVEIGLEGLWPEPVPARLDTGGTSPHVFGQNGGFEANIREKYRRQKRGYHAELVRLLEAMVRGDHGLPAEAVGQKWLLAVKRCPGVVRRHKPCGQLSFEGHRCEFPLCPWYQARLSKMRVKRLGPLVAAMSEPKLWTFSPPNLAQLAGESLSELGKVLTRLHRLAYFKKRVRGGLRAIEVTNGGNGWNVHAHEAVDAGWVAHYPQWDIERKGKRWVVTKRHPGLAREFTRICQKFSSWKSPRLDFDINNPDHWYFVELRSGDAGLGGELCKYVAKGSQVVRAGANAVLDFLLAVKGQRLLQPFGNLYGTDVDAEDVGVGLEPSRPGECPWLDCVEPGRMEYEFYSYRIPEGCQLEFDFCTGQHRVVGLARDGPG